MRQINYFQIGLFIIIGTVVFIVGFIVFGGGGLFKESLVVETYFDGSVQGLNVGSPIKFRGVKIGEVKNMCLVGAVYKISRDIPDFFKYNLYVLVEAEVLRENFQEFTPSDPESWIRDIKKRVSESGLRFKLVPMGITGTAYLELDFVDPKRAEEQLKILWTPNNPYIPAQPSTLAQVTKSLAEIPDVLNRDFYPTLRNVRQSTANLSMVIEKLDEVLINVQAISNPQKITYDGSSALDNNQKDKTAYHCFGS